MKVTVEISMYPLRDDHLTAIDGFIGHLERDRTLRVVTNTLSTQVSGEYDAVFAALRKAMARAHEDGGQAVFVTKFLAGDLLPAG